MPRSVDRITLVPILVSCAASLSAMSDFEKCRDCDRPSAPGCELRFDDIGKPPIRFCAECFPAAKAMTDAFVEFISKSPKNYEHARALVERAEKTPSLTIALEHMRQSDPHPGMSPEAARAYIGRKVAEWVDREVDSKKMVDEAFLQTAPRHLMQVIVDAALEVGIDPSECPRLWAVTTTNRYTGRLDVTVSDEDGIQALAVRGVLPEYDLSRVDPDVVSRARDTHARFWGKPS